MAAEDDPFVPMIQAAEARVMQVREALEKPISAKEAMASAARQHGPLEMSLEQRTQEYLEEEEAAVRILRICQREQTVNCYWSTLVARHGSRPCVQETETGTVWSYEQADRFGNRVARWALAPGRGLCNEASCGLMAENSVVFFGTWIGLAKAGVASAMLNTHLAGAALAHAMKIASASTAVVSTRFLKQWGPDNGRAFETTWLVDGPSAPDAGQDFLACLADLPETPVAAVVHSPFVPLWYIYTSGTTGLPKAVRAPGLALMGFMAKPEAGTRSGMGLTDQDKVYIPLPLYHATGGAVAQGPALGAGACIVVPPQFSASQYWFHIATFKCTATCYVGELWRYLVNRPVSDEERSTSLRVIIGNGLRSDIWPHLSKRFGIREVIEFYGASEGQLGCNNFCGRAGACGYLPPRVREQLDIWTLLDFDFEQDQEWRDPSTGRCRRAAPGAVGLAVSPLLAPFRGYTDNAASDKKGLRDVFRAGDLWYNTGDLLRIDHEGFIFFVDRVGDTFRWRGENVSTNEVCEVVSGCDGIAEANVYGVSVPGAEGRAGMVALSFVETAGVAATLEQLYAHCVSRLPAFARPLFVRLVPPDAETAKTATFKFQKSVYQKQGFDPGLLQAEGHSIYFRDDSLGAFVVLDEQAFKRINSGTSKL